MNDLSYLKVSVKQNEVGVREATNYEWQGRSPYINVDISLVKDQFGENIQNIQIGPYKLILMETNYDYYKYVRADRFGSLRVWLYKVTRMLDLIYRRLIITFAVWGLAEYQASRVPSYKDIKIIKRFIKK